MSSKEKIVELPLSKFEDMVNLIKELKAANKMLNEQIRAYNEEFADSQIKKESR